MPLTPVESEPEWRLALLAAVTAAAAALVVSLVPAHTRPWPLAVLVVTAAAAWLRAVTAPAPPTRLRLGSDGTLRVAQGALERPAVLLPGSRLTASFALLHWREAPPVGRRRSALVLRRDNRRYWRRACLIWRWSPRRSPPLLGVDSAARAPAHRASAATELSQRPRVYGGDRGRAEDD